MADLSTLRAQVRQRLGETDVTFLTDANIDSLLNEAQRVFVNTDGILEADRGIHIVNNQAEYDLPSDTINVHGVEFEEDLKLRYVTQRELLNSLRKDPDDRAEPRFYTIWRKKIRLFPTPNVTGSTTTLDGAIDAVVTTITLDSTDSLPTAGRVLIDSEEIQYFDLDTTLKQLKQCVRGSASTTAASHLDAATMDELDLRIFYYKDTTDMVGDSDVPDIPTEYHETLIYYAAGMARIKDQLFDQGQFFLQLFEGKKLEARGEIKRRQRDRNPRILPSDKGSRTHLGPA